MMSSNCQMNETRLEVSENYEEAELSDVEDEIFIRSGNKKNGFRMEFDIAKKPLMAPTPRKKNRNGNFHTEIRTSPPILKIICIPLCYIIIATFAMLGLIAVITFLLSYVSLPFSFQNIWKKGILQSNLIPCDQFEIDDVWIKQYPKFLTESAFRLLDVNGDGVEDILFGYATGADGYQVPEFVCDIYFGGQRPCFGGVLAIDGSDGSELWRHWTAHEVFALNCNEDLNNDGVRDCLIGGRAGVFCAISGLNGSLLWTFSDDDARNPIMNIYTAQFTRDLNEDSYPDIIAIHGGDPLSEPGSKTRLSGRLMVVSGKDGRILRWVETPDHKESYYSPQILTKNDGTDFLLFGTGGETHSGGLYYISLADLYKGFIENAKAIYLDEKGIMVPPILTDLNRDGVDDIVMAIFNSSVIAFDGNNFEQLWNYTFPSSETYVTPTPGYFNDDEIPDFLVKYQMGPGFPVYFHSKTTILDGSNGKPLLENPIIDSIGSQSSTPLIRSEGYGNDLFLYWSSNCKGFEGNSTEYGFKKGTSVHKASRSDFCKLRFKSKLVNQLRIFNSKTGLPGSIIYDSEFRNSLEYNKSFDTSKDGQAYLQSNPQMWQWFDKYQKDQQDSDSVSGQDSNTNQFIQANLPPPNYPQQGQYNPMQYEDPLLQNPQIYQSQQGQYNIPLANILPPRRLYPMSSQPELTEDVKYPDYHHVGKHHQMKNGPPGPMSMPMAIPGQQQNGPNMDNSPIIVNRRQEQDQNLGVETMWPKYYQNSRYPSALDQQDQGQVGKNDFYGELLSEVNAAAAAEAGSQQLPLNYIPTDSVGHLELEETAFPRSNRFPDLGEEKPQGIYSRSRRVKRHIGPHDADGIQRLISTGTLAKPLKDSQGGIDLIFATYWFFPAKTQAILPKDRDCITEKMSQESQRFEDNNKYSRMDHDQFEDKVTEECLEESLHSESDPNSPDSDSGFETEPEPPFNPFDIHMGQMTVYRLHISCTCSGKLKSMEKCAKIRPFEKQPWTSYMGTHADSYFPKYPQKVPVAKPSSAAKPESTFSQNGPVNIVKSPGTFSTKSTTTQSNPQ